MQGWSFLETLGKNLFHICLRASGVAGIFAIPWGVALSPDFFVLMDVFLVFPLSSSFSFHIRTLVFGLGGGGLVAKLYETLLILWTIAHQTLMSMGFPRQGSS